MWAIHDVDVGQSIHTLWPTLPVADITTPYDFVEIVLMMQCVLDVVQERFLNLFYFKTCEKDTGEKIQHPLFNSRFHPAVNPLHCTPSFTRVYFSGPPLVC